MSKDKDPLKVQVGGDHYKGFKIQPVEYTMANDLNTDLILVSLMRLTWVQPVKMIYFPNYVN